MCCRYRGQPEIPDRTGVDRRIRGSGPGAGAGRIPSGASVQEGAAENGARGAERGAGSTVNLASPAGLRGSVGGAAYTAAKHALIGLTRTGAYTYSARGVRINAVVPMPTRNSLDSNYGFPGGLGPLPAASLVPADPEAAAVAAPVTYLLSDDAVSVTGALLPADEGWSVG